MWSGLKLDYGTSLPLLLLVCVCESLKLSGGELLLSLLPLVDGSPRWYGRSRLRSFESAIGLSVDIVARALQCVSSMLYVGQ